MALGVALVVAVITIYAVVDESFTRNRSLGYHFIVGGKNGSKLELVLSTVFHIGQPEVPVPYNVLQGIRRHQPTPNGKRVVPEARRYVELAVPICLGDNYQGYRVVATLPTIFDFQFAHNQKYTFAEGANFAADESGWYQAVVGAEVARRTGLKVGDTFAPHGDRRRGDVHEKPHSKSSASSPRPARRTIGLFAHMEGFFRMEGHEKSQKAKPPTRPPHSTKLSDDQKASHRDSRPLRRADNSHRPVSPAWPTRSRTPSRKIDRLRRVAQAAQPVDYRHASSNGSSPRPRIS